MATVQSFVAIHAPQALVLRLVADQSQRSRFLPEGWRVMRLITPRHDVVTSAMEVETDVGPGATMRVVQVLGLRDDQVVEGPPTADNFVTTWTVREEVDAPLDDQPSTLVGLHTEFTYGGLIGDFFARRRLARAYAEMLARLKAVAEADWRER
jgi:hypothetical protein